MGVWLLRFVVVVHFTVRVITLNYLLIVAVCCFGLVYFTGMIRFEFICSSCYASFGFDLTGAYLLGRSAGLFVFTVNVKFNYILILNLLL